MNMRKKEKTQITNIGHEKGDSTIDPSDIQ